MSKDGVIGCQERAGALRVAQGLPGQAQVARDAPAKHKALLVVERELNSREHPYATPSIAEVIAGSAEATHVPVTFERCDHVPGPFFHGTRNRITIGERLAAGHPSNYHQGRIANHVYFSSLLEPAVWAAELAVALAGGEEIGNVYVVEPTGPFEDDPNVTDKRFPGNVTRSYRTRQPMRVTDEVGVWERHAPGVLQAMLENLAGLREQGLDLIED